MIDARINAGEIGVVDLKSRQNRQRKAFGLAGRADQAPVVEKLTSVSSRITGLAPNADGSWVVTLADGTQWRTAGDLSGKVAVGNDVVVTRDAFSRYKMASKTGRKAIVYRIR